MSHILDFHARDFRADQSLENCVAERRFITFLGKNIEQFVIGDWHWNWSQIICKKVLEPKTEYVLRFAVMGGVCDTQDEVTQCIIAPDSDWEERCVFELSHSRYQPVLSKQLDDGLLRVYEIPFSTPDSDTDMLFNILFVSTHCKTAILPAFLLEEYADLPDLTYAEWWEHRKTVIASDIKGGLFDPFNPFSQQGSSLNLTGARLTLSSLAVLMSQVGSGANINLTGARIEADEQDDLSVPADDGDPDALIDRIREYLKQYGHLSVYEACEVFQMDAETATSLLGAMHAMKLISFDAENNCYLPLA